MQVILFLTAVGFYFLPAIIAVASHKKQTTPIVLLNLFLGWTVIGWIGALIWSASKD